MAKILVVDDDAAQRKVVKMVIGAMVQGSTVVTAENPAEVLEIFAKFDPDFDLIITDLQMPGMDGDEMATKLRDRGFKKPIILRTGKDLDGTERLRDINEVVAKTCDIDQFVAVIRKHLGA